MKSEVGKTSAGMRKRLAGGQSGPTKETFELNPLEKAIAEILIRNVILKMTEDLFVKELSPKAAELAAASAMGRMTEEQAMSEMRSFINSLASPPSFVISGEPVKKKCLYP